MSILDNPSAVVLPPASIAANSLVVEAREVWGRMVSSFNESAVFFWRNPEGLSPQEIADALGPAGQEIFSLHAKLGQLIASVNPAAIADGLAVVGQFEYREDGSVHILD